jgi:hypothetical protein
MLFPSHNATGRTTRLHSPETQVVDLSDLGAVVGKAVSEKAVSEIEHPNGDFLPQSGSPGLAGLGVVEVLHGGTERGTRPEAEFLSHLSSD